MIKPASELNKDAILSFLRAYHDDLRAFGVERIGLFGSFSNDTAHTESDIDLLVEMKPNFSNLMALLIFLEKNLGRRVDLLRKGPHVRQKFLDSIEKELIYA
jgi:uncharacterized protein